MLTCDPCLTLERQSLRLKGDKGAVTISPKIAVGACSVCRLGACREHINIRTRICVICAAQATSDRQRRATRSNGHERAQW